MQCDMCGANSELFQTKIEGTEMKVCIKCSKYGQVIRRVIIKKVEKKKHAHNEPEIIEVVVKNYSQLIKDAREKKGKTQEELANLLNLKTSLLTNMERGKYKPSVAMALKLEKELHIKLIEQLKDAIYEQKKGTSTSFTFGDFIKKK